MTWVFVVRLIILILAMSVFALFAWILYLELPVSVHPWTILPFALVVSIMASTFKKYL